VLSVPVVDEVTNKSPETKQILEMQPGKDERENFLVHDAVFQTCSKVRAM
jgi:hypothetical protein